MYHDVEEGNPDIYNVEPDRFGEHLAAIERGVGRPPATHDELSDGDWLITFDDGGASALHAGAELARRSWQGYFFIATDLIGRDGYLDWDGVREVAGMGHLIGSHSVTHPDRMATCSWDELMDEWTRSAEILAGELGAPVATASVPGGLYSRDVGRAAAASGYTTLFNSLPSQRVRSIDGCRLIGRYAMRKDARASDAAAAAIGAALPWSRQRAAWELRGAVKSVAGKRYETVRRTLLARR
jgi:peptidoglycan/xylan/chitin deacetylase (PgdA/CDA1 family)